MNKRFVGIVGQVKHKKITFTGYPVTYVKPENVLIYESNKHKNARLKISDFGLTKITNETGTFPFIQLRN